MNNKRTELVNAWIAMHEACDGSEDYKKNFWAFNDLSDFVFFKPLEALDIINQIVATNDSDLILSNVAAGPVEDLLVYHGNAIIGDLEKLIVTNPIWKKLLAAVWQNSISDEVWARVSKIAGPVW